MSAALAKPYLDDMKLFAAVVDCGGFRPAAQQLGLPASTVSDVVRRLEERLGLRLLNRSTRSVMPTDAGRRLLAGLRPAFDLIDEAVSGLNDDAARPVGPLRLTAPGIVARYVLPAIVPDFLNACPDVQVEVSVDDEVVDVVEAGYDAAIRYEERVAVDMVAVPIGPRRQHYVAAAAPAYLARHGRPDHPRDLAGHRLIGHRLPTGAMVAWEFGQGRRTARVTPAGPLITSSIELRVAAAVAGAGLIYTFEEVLRPQLEAGALIPVLEAWWQSFPGPFLCHHGDRRVPGPLRAFIAHIQSRPFAS
jgi:DNA-binding transcriptional LysR family regulator